MMFLRFTGGYVLVATLIVAALPPISSPRGVCRAADSLPALEERAMKDALARVATAVVRIETVGGLERVGELLVGTGPTTGLIVSDDGYIVSSAFNFAQKPDSILISLHNGERVPAKLVATDHSRSLVLLKINTTEKLPVAEAVPRGQIRVGQWSLAVGRTYDGAGPNVSVGIVSAVDRIWGKAIQTDAKISPSNYGGPLCDISGRVLGVLVPLTPDAGGEVAGVEWYDSGIGFAVPLEHVAAVLPKLKAGEDLKPGILGISLKSNDLFIEPAAIAAVRTGSPAHKAGWQAGDTIVEINGHSVTRQAQLKHQISHLYAGDRLKAVVLRGSERIERELELIDKLPAYEYPYLGILPERKPFERPAPARLAGLLPGADGDKKDGEQKDGEKKEGDKGDGDKKDADKPAEPAKAADAAGLVLRQVLPGSPAAEAKLQSGDRILSLAGTKVQGAATIVEKLRTLAPGDTVKLEVRRANDTLALEAKLATLPEAIAPEVPPARPTLPALEAAKPQVGLVSIKLPEFENEAAAYVPENYDARIAYGLVVWLHPAGGLKSDALLTRWKTFCQERDLILLAPKAADPSKWQPTEAAFVRRAAENVLKNYSIDRNRIVLAGQAGGGALAWLVGLSSPELVRGIAVVDAPLPIVAKLPETDPVHRLACYSAAATGGSHAVQIETGLNKLRALKYPVTSKGLGELPRDLNDAELAELVRWIDSLDRL